ncbi:hypothetical protein niasHT_025236 [Heterodera trifolii]|uniref:Protein kinase domain-containing protein n=1 Tax=Heterodera trifolii TaxID=157864 RepID=A0ABD2JGM4_9BILA
MANEEIVPKEQKLRMGPCHCGQTNLSEMNEKLKLTNLEDNATIKLKLHKEEKPIGEGSFSEVQHAVLYAIGARPYNKCVALKRTYIDWETSDWQKHVKEWKIQKAFDALPKNERVIKLIAYGYHGMELGNPNPTVFSILELGQHDLIGHMKQKRKEWAESQIQVGDEQLEPDIRQLVETLRDMHQIIMHLDLKPQNLLYVKKENGEDSVMKAIDFGSAQFIVEEEDVQRQQMANFCKWFVINDPLTTKYYESPEHHKLCNWGYMLHNERSMRLSSKTDIWAIGIIAYEMAYFGLNFGPKLEGEREQQKICAVTNNKKERNKFVAWLWTIFSAEREDVLFGKNERQKFAIWAWFNSSDNKREEAFSEKKYRLLDSLNTTLANILCIRFQFPRLFHLINAILVKEPKKRPTANGILDFLDGKCRFRTVPMPPMLLPWLSMETLKGHVEKALNVFKKDLNNNNSELGERKKKIAKKRADKATALLRMIAKTSAKEWKAPNTDKMPEMPCDTKTTNRRMPAKERQNDHRMPMPLGKRGVNDAENETALKPTAKKTIFATNSSENLSDIEKAIGLSLSPSIQNALNLPSKYTGRFENLQVAFWHRHIKVVHKFGQKFATILSKIGYIQLVDQLNNVFARNKKNDVKMLKTVVGIVRKALDSEWAEIDEMAPAQKNEKSPEGEGKEWHDAENRCWHITKDGIEKLKAMKLYELIYEHILEKHFDNSNDTTNNRQLVAHRKAFFIFDWLREIVSELNTFRKKEQKKILEEIKNRKLQFEQKVSESRKAMDEIWGEKSEEFKEHIDEMDRIIASVKEEIDKTNREIKQLSFEQMKRDGNGKGRTDKNGENEAALKNTRKELEDFFDEAKEKKKNLETNFEAEKQKITSKHEEKMNAMQKEQKLCETMEQKIERKIGTEN